MNESVKKVFFKRKITYLVIFATLIAVYVISASATEFHLSEGLASFPKAMAWIGHNNDIMCRQFSSNGILSSLFFLYSWIHLYHC